MNVKTCTLEEIKENINQNNNLNSSYSNLNNFQCDDWRLENIYNSVWLGDTIIYANQY